jgi:hypothetical protein
MKFNSFTTSRSKCRGEEEEGAGAAAALSLGKGKGGREGAAVGATAQQRGGRERALTTCLRVWL